MRQLVDLTRPMTRDTLVALGGRRVNEGWMVREVQVEFLRDWSLGDNTSQCMWTIGDHLGTHVDAPSHVVADGAAIDAIDLSRLVGEAVVLDVTGARGRGISADDLEAAGTDLHAGDIALLFVDEPAGDLDHYLEHQTYVTIEAAQWFVDRGVTAVGVETACFEHAYQRTIVDRAYEPPETNPWPAHKICLANDIYIIEGLTNLGRLRGMRVDFAAAPLPVPGSSGSPVRAFAWID
ncbi:MAG: putative cyclase family protein [Microbacteriaceae bacterium]|jgi:arylformamidase|nr:putative cyclase family protein [Microbacteriaceae bacterium]